MNKSFIHIVKLVERELESHIDNWRSKKFLIAVSGGPDSVLLLHVFKTLNCEVEIAHVNYNLRGKDSISDEKYVIDLAKKYNVIAHIESVNAKSLKKSGESLQMLARKVRYDFFDEVMRDNDLDYLVLGHHANDQVETVLMNILRGSSVQGLAGMKVLDRVRFRPFLNLHKSDILLALKEEKLNFRIDKSNKKNEYTRNKLRNKIIPMIEKEFPQFHDIMLNNIAEWKSFNENLTSDLPDHRSVFMGTEKWQLSVLSKDVRAKKYFVSQAVFNGFNPKEIKRFIEGRSNESKQLHSSAGVLERKGDSLKYFLSTGKAKQYTQLKFIKSQLELHGLETGFLKSLTEKISLYNVEGELILRKWEAGDKMIPLGMRNFKKVSDMLTDLKLTATQKKQVYVLCDGHKILWLVGFRIDERVKLTGHEKSTEIINLIVKKT